MRQISLSTKAFAVAAVMALSACGDSPFQVIEEVEFAASLGIDLASMELLPSGVYREDSLVGDGFEIIDASAPTVSFEGWLADGTKFGEGSFSFIVGTGGVIPGFEQGVFGMKVGGVRRIIIPPQLGYGEVEQNAIPAGSVLIFQVTLDSMEDPEPGTGEPPQVVGVGR